jgi:antitoxin (DNA-binding transcriptional repressor) of toxin-antitoxin stability system
MDNMTTCGHDKSMRSVKIAEFKSQLSRHLRDVQRGESLIVLDRETPIARVIPIDAGDDMTITLPASDAPPVGKVKLPVPPRIAVDVVELLLADRRSRG